MAQRTNVIGGFANGLVRAEIDWNDANGQMIRYKVVNASDYPANMYALLDPPIDGYSRVDLLCPAHQEVEKNLPTNKVKYTKVIDPDDGSVSWSLIGISIFCRWPA